MESCGSVSTADRVTALLSPTAVGRRRVALGTIVIRGSGVPAGLGVDVGISAGLTASVGESVGVGSEREHAPTTINTNSIQKSGKRR